MNNTIATNYDLVVEKIRNTAESRNAMRQALQTLKQTIENTTQWQGVDAEKHKAALLDFCTKLINSTNWMEAAGNQSIQHASQLKERALRDSNTAARFQ